MVPDKEDFDDDAPFEEAIAEETPTLEIVVDNVTNGREKPQPESFEDSGDFFEEKPHRIAGVISSKEIEEAEDYDVIGVEEQRAEKAERAQESTGEEEAEAESGGGSELLQKLGGGIKSFFIHLGYFFTNIWRAIKRRHAKRKRKRMEEERRLREQERLRQQRARRAEMEKRRDANGLVQVHRRDEHRPSD